MFRTHPAMLHVAPAHTTFVVGSVVTGVSSLCIVAEYDLKKYRELLDKLGDASLDIEMVLD